jgi:hypothetical protein
MDILGTALAASGALPFAFLLGFALLRFAQGADRPRALVDGYLAWTIVSYASAEVFGFFGRIDVLRFFVVWVAADLWVLGRLWRLRHAVRGFWQARMSLPLALAAGFAAMTLFIALTTAPNNWDSQTYHLPRIEHWIQNGSLAFYPVSITRQNEMGPLAEILLLQSRILSGSDALYPLVQWISMICAVAAVFRITRQLGGSETQSWIAAVFLVTLPIGILESTSTQNDYVVAALLACFATLGLEAIAAPRAPLRLVLAAVAAAALSGLVKPVGFLLGAGFAVWFAIGLSWRAPLVSWLGRAAAVPVVLVLVLGPFGGRYLAARDASQSNFAAVAVNASFGIRQTLDNLLRHTFSNLVTGAPPLDQVTFRIGESISSSLSLDAYRQDTTVPGQKIDTPPIGLYIFHEDNGPNLLHTILILMALLSTAVRWRMPAPPIRWGYWAAWLAGVIVFATVLRFGLWEIRYQLPAFVLAAPLVATAWPERWSPLRRTTALLLILGLAGLPVVLLDQSRELVPLRRDRPLPLLRDRPSYLTTSRDERLFVNQPALLAPYRDAVDIIVRSNASRVGLVVGGDSWEYPVWRLLRDRNPGHPVRMEHVGLPGPARFPLGPFVPEIVFWSGEAAPPVIEIEGQEFTRAGPSGTVAVFTRIGLALSHRPAAAELGADGAHMGGIDPHRHGQSAVRAEILGQHLGMPMQPADAGAVGGVEIKLQHHACGGDARFDLGGEAVEPLPAQSRQQDRPPGGRAAFGNVANPGAGVLIKPVDLVPRLDQLCALRGLDTQLMQHLGDVGRLSVGIFVRDVAHMNDHIGFDHLFQGGPKGRHQHGRQVRDEADRIRQDDLGAVRQGDRTQRRIQRGEQHIG